MKPVDLFKKRWSKRRGPCRDTVVRLVVLKPKSISGTARVAKLGTAIPHAELKSFKAQKVSTCEGLTFSELQTLSLACKLHCSQGFSS